MQFKNEWRYHYQNALTVFTSIQSIEEKIMGVAPNLTSAPPIWKNENNRHFTVIKNFPTRIRLGFLRFKLGSPKSRLGGITNNYPSVCDCQRELLFFITGVNCSKARFNFPPLVLIFLVDSQWYSLISSHLHTIIPVKMPKLLHISTSNTMLSHQHS